MVRIEGGSFVMGSPASEPDRFRDEVQRQVTISSFYIAKYPVTVGEFRRFVETTGYVTDVEMDGGAPVRIDGNWEIKEDANWMNPYFNQAEDHPVVFVSWFDAIQYCNWLSEQAGLTPAYTVNSWGYNWIITWDWNADGYRLPTEAEWEYACRAGTTTPFNTGNNITTYQANYDGRRPYNNNAQGEFRRGTTPVGTFAANPWGLYDMHGNVWEWCWDWYGAYASGAQIDPNGAVSGEFRVIRGGSWRGAGQDIRSAGRGGGDPSFGRCHISLRVARNVQ